MKKPTRQEDGHYHVNGQKYKFLKGSRAQVYNGTAYKTKGNLKKDDLLMNKWGRIVSKKKHFTEKKKKTLFRMGFRTKKGRFGVIKMNKTRRVKK